MDELIAALNDLEPVLVDIRELADVRERDGGAPLVDFLEEIDTLIPELAHLCTHRWMLELVLRLCRMRGDR